MVPLEQVRACPSPAERSRRALSLAASEVGKRPGIKKRGGASASRKQIKRTKTLVHDTSMHDTSVHAKLDMVLELMRVLDEKVDKLSKQVQGRDSVEKTGSEKNQTGSQESNSAQTGGSQESNSAQMGGSQESNSAQTSGSQENISGDNDQSITGSRQHIPFIEQGIDPMEEGMPPI